MFIVFLYQLAILFIFHVGRYYNFNFNQLYIGIFLLIVLFLYYLICFFKKKKTMNKLSNIFYIISLIFNFISLWFITTDLFNLFFIISILTIIVIIGVNILEKFVFKIEDINNKKISKLIIFVLSICTIVPFGYGIVGTNLANERALKIAYKFLIDSYDYKEFILNEDGSNCDQFRCEFQYSPKDVDEYMIVIITKKNYKLRDRHLYCLDKKSCFDKAKDIASKYLREKYGDFEYQFNEEESRSLKSRYTLYFDSKYTNETFYVEVFRDNYEVSRDNFLLLYFSKLYQKDFMDMYEVCSYLSNEISLIKTEELLKKYDAKIVYGGVLLDVEEVNEKKFGKLPTINDFFELVTFRRPEILIYKKFNNDELKSFEKYMIDMYEDIGEDDTLFFDFNYINPFYEGNIAYEDGGYIRDAGSIYLLYVKPKPYQIDK